MVYLLSDVLEAAQAVRIDGEVVCVWVGLQGYHDGDELRTIVGIGAVQTPGVNTSILACGGVMHACPQACGAIPIFQLAAVRIDLGAFVGLERLRAWEVAVPVGLQGDELRVPRCDAQGLRVIQHRA